MAKFKVNKIEAAQRQIDTAIRMLFSNEDPVAIHTLAMASFRILCDLANKRDVVCAHNDLRAVIKPGMEKIFWKKIRSPANFLKHADKDPDAILNNVDEKVNDIMLFMACRYYQDLGYQFTPEMIAFDRWFYALYPEVIKKEHNSTFRDLMTSAGNLLHGMSRQEQLAIGQQLLQSVRNRPLCY